MLSLFQVQDLVLLSKENLGLRLTHNTTEAEQGGFGDAIPLSHLAGAHDIIEFVRLSFLPELPRARMEEIYNRYKENDVRSTSCMPRLMLHYAAQHDIGDAKERLSHQQDGRSIAGHIKLQIGKITSEVKKLSATDKESSGPYLLEHIVKDCPYLAKELVFNFNEKLQLRLSQNWVAYANRSDMDYLFLTNNTGLYQSGYDFNRYPPGKVGQHKFNASDILEQVMFFSGEYSMPDSKKDL
jgi:hypothetical protein